MQRNYLWTTVVLLVGVAILGANYVSSDNLLRAATGVRRSHGPMCQCGCNDAGASPSAAGMDEMSPYQNRYLTEKGGEYPPLWLYYDTNDVNSRWWADFGARSSFVLNVPFLNLCYGTIVAANGQKYRVEIIGGLAGVAERLGEDALPPKLQSEIARVGPAEINWIRAAILAKYGGLWLDPSTICLSGFGDLPENNVVFFGTDTDGETYAGPNGTGSPSLRAIWSPKPEHPVFVAWADAAYRRLYNLHTGGAARRDDKWDFVSFAAKHPQTVVLPAAELSRDVRTGKKIQLEELLASGQEGMMPFAVPAGTVYVPMPWLELRDRRAFGWFLRLSETQIMESDLVVRDLLLLANNVPVAKQFDGSI